MRLIILINALINAIKTIITIEIIKRKRKRKKESITYIIKKDTV